RGRVAQVDSRHQTPASSTDSGYHALLLGAPLVCGDHEPQPILDQRGQGASLRGGLAFGAIEKFLGQSDSGSLGHMSGHMPEATICQPAGDRLVHLSPTSRSYFSQIGWTYCESS